MLVIAVVYGWAYGFVQHVNTCFAGFGVLAIVFVMLSVIITEKLNFLLNLLMSLAQFVGNVTLVGFRVISLTYALIIELTRCEGCFKGLSVLC